MAEYIEKHKAVNLLTSLENEFQQFKPFKGFEHAMYRKLCETEIAIGKIPAADVVPVAHGWWDESKEHFYLMNGCKEWINFYCSECDAPNNSPTDYCPNCGAKMDGGAVDG